MHAKRAFTPEFGTSLASDAERGFQPNIGREAQDFMAWRRSMLLISSLCLAVMASLAVVNLIDALNQTDTADARAMFDVELANFLAILQAGAKVALAWFAWRALKLWHDLPRSHKSQKLGWVIGLLVPFVVALVPARWLLHMQGADEGQRALAVQMVGLSMGLTYFMMLMPSVLAIFVGAIRAALVVVKLLPESPIPGWVVAVFAPVLSLLLLAMFVVINQIGGSTLLLVGFLCVFANYALYIRNGARLARAYSRDEIAREFGTMRGQTTVLLGVGVVLIVVALLSTQVMGMKLVGGGVDEHGQRTSMFSYVTFVELIIELIGKSTFTALLLVDLLIAAVLHARHAAVQAQASPLTAALDKRLAELAAAGVDSFREVANWKDGGGPPPAAA